MPGSAACQTVGPVDALSLLHYGKLSPEGATALSKIFSNILITQHRFQPGTFKCKAVNHFKLLWILNSDH